MIRFAQGKLRRKEYAKQSNINKKQGLISLDKDWLTKKRNEHNSKQYTSEKWFKHVLKKNLKSNCLVQCNKPILNRFFLDFYFPSISIAVEVDGSSHENSLEYDKIRDISIIEHSIIPVVKIYRLKYGDSVEANRIILEIDSILESLPAYTASSYNDVSVYQQKKPKTKYVRKKVTFRNKKKKKTIKKEIDLKDEIKVDVRENPKPLAASDWRKIPKKYHTKEMKLERARADWVKAGLDVAKLEKWFK